MTDGGKRRPMRFVLEQERRVAGETGSFRRSADVGDGRPAPRESGPGGSRSVGRGKISRADCSWRHGY